MGDFLDNFSYICEELLPFLGICVLIVLFIVLIKLVKLLSTLNSTIEKTHPSIDLVEKTLDKAQVPVDTAVKVSKGIDKAYDVSSKAIDEAKEFVVKNATVLRDKVSSLVKQESEVEEDCDDDDVLKEEL